MFIDPTGTVSIALPATWAFDAISSSLTDLVFLDWTAPATRQIFVHIRPTTAGVSDDEWEAETRAQLPNAVTRVERRPGPIVLVERPGREGRPHQRWAFIRGSRLETLIEQVGVPLGGALLTEELTQAIQSLDVPANRHLGELRAQAEWNAAMQTANEHFHAGEIVAAVRELSRARQIAKDTWLFSLTGLPLPEIPAAIAEAEAALALTRVTGSAIFLQQATLTLHRARASLLQIPTQSTEAQLRRADLLLSQAFQIHGEMSEGGAPNNPISATITRAELLFDEFRKVIDAEPKKGHLWAKTAIEESMSAVAYAARSELRSVPDYIREKFIKGGVTDPAEQLRAANDVLQIAALRYLVAAGGALQAAQSFAALDADRIASANWLLAARRLASLSPSSDHDRGLVLALNANAAAFATLGDAPSLETADGLLAEAHGVLDQLGEEGELRAQVLLGECWVRHYRRELPGTLELLDRCILAAQRAGADRLERGARSLRSQFLTNAGRHEEAVAEARRALAAPYDDAAGGHHLNLAIALHAAGDHCGAIEEVRAGLAVAAADQPMSSYVLRLLFVASNFLERSDSKLSLASTEAAETLLDVLRLRIGADADRIAFDDADRHRDIAGALVQRRLAADDILGALATADRHRARSLVQLDKEQADDESLRSPELKPSPPDASISELIAFISAAARAFLVQKKAPSSFDGPTLIELAAIVNRTIVLMHPSAGTLYLFVICPGKPVRIFVAKAEPAMAHISKLAAALRCDLGMVLASRAARGELPAQSIEVIAAALADNDDEEQIDSELNRLRRELHEALFSNIEPFLDKGEPIVVVPYRELAVIPLAILTAADGRPLAAHHPLSILPSLASLFSLKPPRGKRATAVILGDPVVSAESGLPPLAHAADEAKHVEKVLRDAKFQTTLLLRETATEAAFRSAATDARVVHLACHAAVRETAAASPLFLTPASPEDGLLLPSEIADLRLDGALVVLAACQTGLGRATVDGILGLGRAFMQAGARTVVLSLWRVSDAATEHLMRAFYDALLGRVPQANGAFDVADALRYAQGITAESVSAHPSAWGPWIIVGDGGHRLM